MPPLGPLHLGAAARERGHGVRFLDLALLVRRGELPCDDTLIAACAELLLAQEPDVLGLGAMISSMPAALHLAAEVAARRPELPIILGGQGPETVEEAIVARYPAIAAVAVGEAESSFVEWLDALDGDGNLLARSAACDAPGLVVRRDGRPHRTPPRAPAATLDALPPPAWDLAESPRAYAAAAGGGEALFPMDLGRGCTYACSFCTTPVFWGRTARQLSPQRAADAFDRLAQLDGLDCVYVTHDLFTFDRQRVLDICAEKLRRGNTLPWECRTRLDLVDGELLSAMRAAGCRRILYGVESDAPAVLARMNKGGRSASLDVRAALAEAARAGMASILGLMCGVPGEQPEEVEANLQLAAEAAVLDGVSLSLHWWNVTPGNGRAAEAAAADGSGLLLLPGTHADLVRGHDLPAGHVHPAQAALIAADPEVFAAFRVFAPRPTTPLALALLTRNAHLLLEVLPRTLRLLAARRGLSLRALLDEALAQWHAEGGADWAEAHLMQRPAAVAAGVRLAEQHAATRGEPEVAALAHYERALHETADARLLRLPVDPLPLVAAIDAGRLPAADRAASGPPTAAAILFVRQGERVRALALSAFMADVYEQPDDARVVAAWPTASRQQLAQARALLAAALLGHPTRQRTPAG